MADEGPDEDPTEVRVQWTVPAPTPDGEEPAAPWGRPGEEDEDQDDEDDGDGTAPTTVHRPERPERPAGPAPAPGSTGAPAAAPAAAAPAAAAQVAAAPTGSTAGAPDADDGRRATLVVAVVAIAAVIVLVAGALVVVLATRDDEPEAVDRTTTTTTAPATTAADGLEGEVDIGAGVTAIVPEGALSDDAELVAEPMETPSSVGPLVTPIGDTVQIILVRGRQNAPIGLRFPYAPPADLPTADGTVPPGAVFALHRDAGTWVPLPVDVDEARGTATFETASLSPFGLFTWSLPTYQSVTGRVLGGLAGEKAAELAPTCDGTEVDVSATGDGEAVAWCAEEDGGERVVRAANVSDHAATVRWTDGVEARADDITPLGEQLTGVETASGDRVVVLGPGGRATFVLPRGQAATLTVTYDGAAHAVTGLLAAARVLQLGSPDMPWKGEVAADQVEADVAASGCAGRLVPDMAVAAGAWRAALGTCLGPDALTGLVGEGAAAPVAVLLRQLAEPPSGDHAALVDALRADTEVEIAVPQA